MIKRYGKFTLLSQFVSFKDFLGYLLKRRWPLIKRELRYFKQRLVRGWDDSETWNFDKEIAEFSYPRLKRYFEVTITAPPYVREGEGFRELSEKEWELIKKKILYALNETRLNGRDPYGHDKNWKVIEEGWELFYKFRRSFWW